MPDHIPSPHDVAELIEAFLRRLCSGQETRALSAFADIDLTFSQVRMLMVLAHADAALPITRIAVRLGLTLASAGRNVDRLLHEELVERNEDVRDRIAAALRPALESDLLLEVPPAPDTDPRNRDSRPTATTGTWR